MKAKTNTWLVVVALLAYWVGLCNASAFYDPGTQRWLNRDPLGDVGGVAYLSARIIPNIDYPNLFEKTINFNLANDSLNDSAALGDWIQVNANLFGGIANNSVNQVDPFGLDAGSYANCVESRRNPLTEQLPNWISDKLAKSENLGSGNGSGKGPHVPAWVPPALYGANAVANKLVGPTGRSSFGIKSHPTDWQHKLGSKFGTTGSRIGKLAGRAAIVLTVFEGFWDIGTIAGCGIAQAID